jgi:hypothetical protein
VGYLRDYMNADRESTVEPVKGERAAPGMSKDEVALELTRFIAVTTGLGKTTGSAGFGGKAAKTPEEQVDTLLELYQRCRAVVEKA